MTANITVNSKSRILREADPIGNYVADPIVGVSESYILRLKGGAYAGERETENVQICIHM